MTDTTDDPTPPPSPMAVAPLSTADDHRRLLREAERDCIDAELAASIRRVQLAAAREAAGLPAQDADWPGDRHCASPGGRLAVVARVGGGDGEGGGWTPDRQRAFLGHLAETASVTLACRLVGLSKQSAYALRARTPQSIFAILWDVAVRQGRRRLYDEALERALAGRAVPVWHRGEEVGTRQVHNDRLLMFLLAHEPPPAHPVLDQRQLAELWPALMAEVDAVLPPSLTPDRVAAMVADDALNGNDRRR